MTTLDRMGAENAIEEYWGNYSTQSQLVSSLNAFGLDGEKASKLADKHYHRWPEKLTSYHAGKIIAKCERKET